MHSQEQQSTPAQQMARETESQTLEAEALVEQVAPEEHEACEEVSKEQEGYHPRTVTRRVLVRGRCSLQAPPAWSWEDRTVIRPVGVRQ
jgi:hypothetical protein